jgi:hypothetical protein
MLDNKTIETLSTNAVKNAVCLSPYLSEYIDDNDKTPSWDGFVYVYNTPNKKKDNFRGRVPVQIKGRCKDISKAKDKITDDADIVDLESYLKSGGVIYFVVYVEIDGHRNKIYYSSLLPNKLQAILEQAKGQTTIAIELKSFPNDSRDKTQIFTSFLSHSNKQHSFAEKPMPSLQNLKWQEGNSLFMSLSGYGFGSADLLKPLLNKDNDHCFYVGVKGSDILQPLKHSAGVLTEIKIPCKAVVSIDGVPFYEEYVIVRSEKEEIVEIGQSFKLVFKHENKLLVSYNLTGFLRQRIKDTRFILNVFKAKYITVNGKNICLNITDSDLKEIPMDELKEDLAYWEKVVCMLDLLNICNDIKISLLTERDMISLNVLVTAFVDKKPISGLNFDKLSTIFRLNVAGIKIALIALTDERDSDTYYLRDFFDTSYLLAEEYKNGEKYPISRYIYLNKDDYLTLANINYNLLLPSFEQASINPYNYDHANKTLLTLLSVFDESNSANKLILKIAKDLTKWLVEAKDYDWSYEHRFLNYLQVIKREREFNVEEKNWLCEIISSTTSEDVRIGAHLLLENQEMAEFCFEKLSDEEKIEFKRYPIFKFWYSNTT